MTPDLRIGSSGWSYPTGLGTWNGVFYPPTRGRAKGFDELAFYAAHFDTVEVNSTFYGQPRADVCRHWAERTPPGFEFSVKLYQKFTHPKMFGDRVTASLPDDGRDPAGYPRDPHFGQRGARKGLGRLRRSVGDGRLGPLCMSAPAG